MPPVPLNWNGHAAAGAHVLLDGEMGVLHQPLRPRQPVLLAVAPFDAGLHEGAPRLGQQAPPWRRAASRVAGTKSASNTAT
jgi:hypothetical protein